MTTLEDTLSDILRLVRLRACVYFTRTMDKGWGMDIPASVNSPLHLVLEGNCLLHIGGREIVLSAGDAVLLAHGERHTLLDSATAVSVPGPELIQKLMQSPDPGPAADGARILCGHFEWDGTLDHPLFAELPDLIVVRNMLNRDGGVLFRTVIELIAAEQSGTAPGAAAVADRMGEVLFVSLLRVWMMDQGARRGVLATMSDARLSRALNFIHRNHAEPVDLIQLAQVAGMSRTAFAVKFHSAMGMPPKSYLTEWRMLEARKLLTRTDIAMSDIAERVGYGSDAAFVRAFKRRFGETPARLRRDTSAQGFVRENSTEQGAAVE